MTNITKLRKGDIYMANLRSNSLYQLQAEHPVIIMTCHLGCIHNNLIQCIPLTSQTKKPMESHILIDKQCGLELDLTALVENIISIDKKDLLFKIGQLSKDLITKVDRATSIQMNLNRLSNLEHCQRLIDAIIRIKDSITIKILWEELEGFAYMSNIDLSRMLRERGLDYGTGNQGLYKVFEYK